MRCVLHAAACLLACAPASFAQAPGELAPGRAVLDCFHPERATPAAERVGGGVVVHVPALPPTLNAMIESSGVARQINYELHESLVRRDGETWRYVPGVAERFEVEDTLVLRDGARLYGAVTARDDDYVVTPHSRGKEPSAATGVPKALVERLERETVFTFCLADGVRWHDGQPLTARDVVFSFECYRNAFVRCDRKRAVFDRIERVETLDDATVRFYFPRSYFLALASFDETFTLLPAHLYDLADPSRGAQARVASAEEQARVVNEGPANRAWIGLGAYRLVEWASDRIVARRVAAYFDESRAGLLETITWRAIGDNEAATAALLDGQLDFFDRLSIVDYFGPRTHTPEFEARFYTGFFYTPALNITAWNTARPELADARVRTALGLCFDWRSWLDGYYKGLAFRVTGEQMPFGPVYDRSLAPLEFDTRRASALLAEAGWIDRDGDGALDKDGAKLELDYLFPSGNEVSRAFGEVFQAQLAKVGVALIPVARDNAALAEALKKREFDACALALALPFESDPEQLWHSKWAASPSANRAGLRDVEVDRLIEAVQVEADAEARSVLFANLQRRLYELQPVMFGAWAPHRFAMARRVRGFQMLAPDPGYSLRRWYVTDAEEGR